MCGICGIFKYADTSFEITEDLIISMRDTMVHRGPDDAGIYLSPERKVALGHRRLSIIDLTPSGRQPMCNEDGSIWLIYNGEIYNHQALRKDLESRGHRYKSHTDSESILHLYEEKGTACVHDLDGMFAFAIWDSHKQQMFFARDRIGKKPLYYAIQNGQLIYGSEIKAILAHPQIQRDMDTTALYHYLTLYVTPSPMTLFKGISKLPPGYIMLCDKQGNIKQERYWDAIVTEQQVHSEDYYIENIRQLLSHSIEKRMMSDVPFGVFLSGGIDSSTNVALMARIMNRPVETFSVGFKDQPAYDEFNYARQVATEFKTNHHEVTIDQHDLMNYIDKMIYHQDEPLADWVCVPLYYVSKLARDNGTIVIQIGEGSDELFFGYDGYMTYQNIYHKYWKPYMKIPRALRRAVFSAFSPLSPFIGKGPGLKQLLRSAAYDEELFWGGAIAFSEVQKQQILNSSSNIPKLNSHEIVKGLLAEIDTRKPDADYIERMIYLELKHRLPELLLMRVDKITMSASVEGRAPYLDHKLVEFAMGIPGNLKVKNGQTKYILKKAVQGLIPDNIIRRKKQGFVTPVKEWFNNELGDYMANSILNSRIKDLDIFDLQYIDKMLTRQKERKSDNSAQLWTLFNLCGWYDYWIAGEKS